MKNPSQSSTMTSYFNEALSSETDLEFVTLRGLRCRAHQLYLSMFIPCIQNQLGKTDMLTILVPGFEFRTVDLMVRFLYTGKIMCKSRLEIERFVDLVQAIGVKIPFGSIENFEIETTTKKRPLETAGKTPSPTKRKKVMVREDRNVDRPTPRPRKPQAPHHSCNQCDSFKTSNVKDLLAHLTTEHYADGVAKIKKTPEGFCPYCFEPVDDQDFLVHYGVEHEYVLNYLSPEYKHQLGFQKVKPEYSLTYPQCPDCQVEIEDTEEFLQHQTDHNSAKFSRLFKQSMGRCMHCEKTFLSEASFEKHVGVDHMFVVSLMPEEYQDEVIRHMVISKGEWIPDYLINDQPKTKK